MKHPYGRCVHLVPRYLATGDYKDDRVAVVAFNGHGAWVTAWPAANAAEAKEVAKRMRKAKWFNTR